MIYINTFS